MTVPHLMNCPHSDDGWCLACVAELGNENWKLREAAGKIMEQSQAHPLKESKGGLYVHGFDVGYALGLLQCARRFEGIVSCSS